MATEINPNNPSSLTEDEMAEIQRIQAEIDLSSSSAISTYGNLASSGAAIDALSQTMERAPTTSLAGKIAEIVTKLEEADPRKVEGKSNWLTKMTGADLENKVRYQVSRKAVDTLLEEADRMTARVVMLVDQLDKMIETHAEESRGLRLRIVAGRAYLEANPTAGIPPEGEITFDNPRERFARRLTSMSALLSSHEMSVAQMKLARGQALDMIERYHEISSVLVPVWRQHTLALVSNLKNSPESIAVATKAHESLMNSLAALKGNA